MNKSSHSNNSSGATKQLSILQRVKSVNRSRSTPCLQNQENPIKDHFKSLLASTIEEADIPLIEELVPISDSDTPATKSGMKKSVSFSSFNTMEKIPSRQDLLEECEKDHMWFGKQDIGRFVEEELSRRQHLGISSTKALDPSVPDFDLNDDEDELGLSF
eukprot:CAMPEP_0178925792 /NCGR_PEP_ID=MMETSP0786-20121207/18131_1 /TAXON_ID=186022 /ORGANISM="Thalassionema frauenfeldii, Strain CCMP 1798" /LENGTH=159 /DNA_ID=CAMNT_0020600757 /DNA_START=151 /DNA_END=630 /DNA_ORIENTATION=+